MQANLARCYCGMFVARRKQPSRRINSYVVIKGSLTRDFLLQFFFRESVSTGPLSSIRAVLNFFETSRIYVNWSWKSRVRLLLNTRPWASQLLEGLDASDVLPPPYYLPISQLSHPVFVQSIPRNRYRQAGNGFLAPLKIYKYGL